MLEQARATRQDIPHDSLRYAPSWVDRVTDWVDRLPGIVWLYYLGATVITLIVSVAVKWWDGSIPVGTYTRFGSVVIITTFYYPAFIFYLDKRAKQALEEMRPVLIGSDAEIERLRYRLTTMPARPVWLFTVLGVLYGVLVLIAAQAGILDFPMQFLTSWPAAVIEVITASLCNMLLFIFVYHTFHQLRSVNAIYTRHTEIDLFNLSPLYAFSRLTAQTSIGILLLQSIWLTIDYGGGIEISSLIVLLVLLGLSAITFLLPLLGIHRLLEDEKRRLTVDASQFLKKSLADFRHCAESGAHDEMDKFLKMIDGAESQIAILARIPTWPWRPGTPRGLITALLLPIIVWLITRVLERFITI